MSKKITSKTAKIMVNNLKKLEDNYKLREIADHIKNNCIYLGSDKTWGWDLYIGFTNDKYQHPTPADLSDDGDNPIGVVVHKDIHGAVTNSVFNLADYYQENGLYLGENSLVSEPIIKRATVLGVINADKIENWKNKNYQP